MSMLPPIFTTAQAAKLLGYSSRRGLLEAVERGDIVPFGKRGGTYVFDEASVLATLKGHARAFRPSRPEAPRERARTSERSSAAQPWAVSTPEAAQVTLGDFAASWLVRETRWGDLQRLTGHRCALTLAHLSPRLRNMRMGDVTPAEVEQLVGHCTDSIRQHYSTVAPHEARVAADSVSRLVFPTEDAMDRDGPASP